MSKETRLNQCQTNGQDLSLLSSMRTCQLSVSTHTLASYQSTPNQCAWSVINILHGHKQTTINAKPMGTILNLFIKAGNNYSLAVISSESLYQLMFLRFICYKLKLIDIITIPTSLSILHDKGNHVTYYSTVKIGAIKMYVIMYITWLSYSCCIFIRSTVQ